jgi:hypothetical protein
MIRLIQVQYQLWPCGLSCLQSAVLASCATLGLWWCLLLPLLGLCLLLGLLHL